jgi:nitronate monooxygenase
MVRPVLHNAFCDSLGIEYPIFLAGMGVGGRATPPKLVAAVSQAGGCGVLGCSGLSPEETRRRIRAVRSLTDRPFGVDLLLPARIANAPDTRSGVRDEIKRRYPEHAAFVQTLIQRYQLPAVQPADETVVNIEYAKSVLDVVFEEGVPIFAAGLGDPDFLLPRARAQGMKLIGLSGSVRNAVRQRKSGVDAIVAQGTEAGGHTGTVASLPLDPAGRRRREPDAGDRRRRHRRWPRDRRRTGAGRAGRLAGHRLPGGRRMRAVRQLQGPDRGGGLRGLPHQQGLDRQDGACLPR